MCAIEDVLRILFGAFIVVMTVITVVRKMRSGVKNHYGMLVKRPLLITEDTVLTGFKEEDWRKAL